MDKVELHRLDRFDVRRPPIILVPVGGGGVAVKVGVVKSTTPPPKPIQESYLPVLLRRELFRVGTKSSELVLFTFPNDWIRGLSFTMCGANKVATVVVVVVVVLLWLLTWFFWSSWRLCTLDANGVDNKYASVKGRHIITDGPPCKSKLFADSFVYVQCR